MTTVKNKAEKLVLAMHSIDNNPNHYMSMFNAKQCALVAINEILNVIDEESLYFEYWEEVKTEIQKML